MRSRVSFTRSRTALAALCALVALCLASPLAAYTVYLKNGTAFQTKGKYRVEKGKAYMTMANGTQSFIDLKEIDVERTEKANPSDYGGNAEILEQGITPPPDEPPPPPRQRKLSDLIASRNVRELPGARRQTPATDTARPAGKTKAGYIDLAGMPRRPYAQADVLAELQQFFHGQGIDDVEIFAGTHPDRPLVEVTTSSEGAVFRGLSISANALLHVRDRFPGKVAALELVLMTPSREHAGQFVLTPEMAADVVAKKVELTAFFLENVQF